MTRGGKTILPVAITCALTAGLTVAALKTPWSAIGGQMLSSLGAADFSTLMSGGDQTAPAEAPSTPESGSSAATESATESASAPESGPALDADAVLLPEAEPAPLPDETAAPRPQPAQRQPPPPPAELTALAPASAPGTTDPNAIDYAKLNRDIKVVTDTLDRFNQKLMRMIAQAKAEQTKERAAADATAVALDKKPGGSK